MSAPVPHLVPALPQGVPEPRAQDRTLQLRQHQQRRHRWQQLPDDGAGRQRHAAPAVHLLLDGEYRTRFRTGPLPTSYRPRIGPVPAPYRSRTGPVSAPYRFRIGPVPARIGPAPAPYRPCTSPVSAPYRSQVSTAAQWSRDGPRR